MEGAGADPRRRRRRRVRDVRDVRVRCRERLLRSRDARRERRDALVGLAPRRLLPQRHVPARAPGPWGITLDRESR
jgi:hypothetical protein